MAEQEQKQKQETLEQKLMRIGFLNSSRVHIKEAAKANDSEALYQEGANLAAIIAEGNQQKYDDAYGDIRVSPSEAMRYANKNIQFYVNDANESYKQEKDKLIKKLIAQMNSHLKAIKINSKMSESEAKATAASTLAQYFNDMVNIPKLTQARADKYAREEAAEALHVDVNYSATADSIEQYEAKHREMYLRGLAVNYLKEDKKDGKVIGYSVDEKKLAKELEETGDGNGIRKASAMYTNALGIQEQQMRARQEAKAAKEKAKK